ncbi:hypothetical protein ACFYZ9_10140 [Streptomyces sp. NPDC001691]|uniref:hypothetical protein n=1 Tax=Streptomyces sp. NPDC001691 TaxID=3364600 RepID=UPI003681306B
MSGGEKTRGGKRPAAAVRGLGPRGMALAWAVVVMVATVSTLGPALLDFGLGVVFGLIMLIVLYAWVLRHIAFGSRPVPRWARVTYWVGGALMVVGAVHAPDAFLALTGKQGTATIAYASTETGSHGTKYLQCWVDLPDGNTEKLPRTGACPAPRGAARTVVYSPGGVVAPLLTAKSGLLWWWAAGFQLAGLAMLTTTAVLTVHDPVRERQLGRVSTGQARKRRPQGPSRYRRGH